MERVALTVTGHVRSLYTESGQSPKGPSARHDAEGTLELSPELEPGLIDIVRGARAAGIGRLNWR
jgi:tRNA (Thr-GGU) A37 N-methylase